MRVIYGTITGMLCVLALGAVGCAQQNTYRDDAEKQNAEDARVRDQKLAPVLGIYCGLVTMAGSGAEFEAKLTLLRGEDNVRAVSSDPTIVEHVPKLAGSMRFPAMERAGSAAYASLPELAQAMGGLGALPFDEGDYDPVTREIYLPFSIPGHAGGYGEVRGQFDQGRFTGTWYSNSFQVSGTFDFKKCGGPS